MNTELLKRVRPVIRYTPLGKFEALCTATRAADHLRRLSCSRLSCVSEPLAMPSQTIEVDYDHPRNGPVCFAAEAGDRIKFAWHEQHNLHRFPSRHAYDSCAFGAAERLASAGPRPEGVVVDFGGDDAYFSCSKICKSNGHKVRICLNNTRGCRGCCGFVNASATSPGSPPTCPPPLGPAPLETAFVPLLVCGCGAVVLLLMALAYYRWCRQRTTGAKPAARATV